MKKVALLFAAIILMAFTSNIIAQGNPQTINYQSVLKDAGGVVVPNGDYNIILQLCDSESGGFVLWEELQTINATGSGGGTISGSGSANYLPLFTNSTIPGNSNIYQTANGNIGIGTTNPQQRLHISGLARFDLPTGQINLSTPGGNPGIISFALNGNRRDLIFDDLGIRLFTGSSPTAPTNGISIVDNGNVGIGTGFPSYPLQVIEFNYAC